VVVCVVDVIVLFEDVFHVEKYPPGIRELVIHREVHPDLWRAVAVGPFGVIDAFKATGCISGVDLCVGGFRIVGDYQGVLLLGTIGHGKLISGAVGILGFGLLKSGGEIYGHMLEPIGEDGEVLLQDES